MLRVDSKHPQVSLPALQPNVLIQKLLRSKVATRSQHQMIETSQFFEIKRIFNYRLLVGAYGCVKTSGNEYVEWNGEKMLTVNEGWEMNEL